MQRPVAPDQAERPQIRKAMRAARVMKWGATPVFGIGTIAAVIIGVGTAWYVGLIVFAIVASLLVVGYGAARCPHCGQLWGSGLLAWRSELPVDETETFVCRRCRLDIGLGLRG